MRRYVLPFLVPGLIAGMLLAGIPAAHAGFHLGSLCFGAARVRVLGPDAIISNLMEKGRKANFVGIQETTAFRPRKRSSRQRVTQSEGRRRIVYLAPEALKGKELYVEGGRSVSPIGGLVSPEIGLSGDVQRVAKRGLGTGHVAGRRAWVVEIRPETAAGSRKIWVDAEKWVPLKWEDYDASGTLVSTTAYTEIRFDGSIPEVFQPRSFMPQVQPVQTSLGEAEEEVHFHTLKPHYLPKGYRRQAVTVASFGAHQTAKRVTVVYSSGLGVITLVQAPAQAIRNAPKPGTLVVSPLGQLVWVNGEVHCVLRATPPLSLDEMKKIAASVK